MTSQSGWTRHYDRYSDAQRQQLIDGVERVARGDVAGDRVTVARSITEAFTILSVIALDHEITAPEAREIPDRVMRIFAQSSNPVPKYMALMLLGDLLRTSPPEAAVITELLMSVASGPTIAGDVKPIAGIKALQNACDVGLPAIRRLHDEKLVKNVDAVVQLEDLARRGFQLERATRANRAVDPIRRVQRIASHAVRRNYGQASEAAQVRDRPANGPGGNR